MRGKKHLFEIKRKVIGEALIQAETQTVFWLGGILVRKKRGTIYQWEEGISLSADKLTE